MLLIQKTNHRDRLSHYSSKTPIPHPNTASSNPSVTPCFRDDIRIPELGLLVELGLVLVVVILLVAFANTPAVLLAVELLAV